MASDDISCEKIKIKRKEVLSDKSLIDGLILSCENLYEIKFARYSQDENEKKEKT